MKNIIIVLLLTGLVKECEAQFFAQKKTRRELLLKQIAALQVYTGYLKKGYDIAKSGINTINDIKNGDLDLHSIFFDSYKQVNPAILNYSKVPETMGFALAIQKSCSNAITSIDTDRNFTSEEKAYAKGVLETMLKKTVNLIEKLNTVIANDLAEMKDADRITWIDKIYDDIKSKYTFVQSFSKSTQVLSAQRTHQQKEINSSKILNGLP